MSTRKRLGEIFVEQGIITEKTMERMLCRAKILKQRFGAVLENMELVTGEEMANALAAQYGFKVVSNLLNYSYPPEVLKVIPVEVAIERTLFPLRLDGSKLALAMADPTDTKVVKNIAANNDLTIVPFIATKTEIHQAICKHYLGKKHATPEVDSVLIVDDDPISLDVLATILKSKGYHVITATNGMEAFKTAIAENPSLVITDLVMPKLDGYGLFDALQNVPEMMFTPVILISAITSDEEEPRAFSKGFFDFIPKPVKEVTLLVRVKRALIFQKHRYRFAHEPGGYRKMRSLPSTETASA